MTIVSADTNGQIEYWSSTEFIFPDWVDFDYKSESDLYEFAKSSTYPVSLEFSRNGKLFACMSKDRKVAKIVLLAL